MGCNHLDIFSRKVKHVSKNEPSNPDNRVLEYELNVIPMAEGNPVNACLPLLGRNFVQACVHKIDYMFYGHHDLSFLKQPLKCIINSERPH